MKDKNKYIKNMNINYIDVDEHKAAGGNWPEKPRGL